MADAVKKNEKKGNWFIRVWARICKFFKDLVAELKKVSWPSKKQVFNNTVSVLAFCFMVGAVIWVMDILLGYLVRLIYGA